MKVTELLEDLAKLKSSIPKTKLPIFNDLLKRLNFGPGYKFLGLTKPDKDGYSYLTLKVPEWDPSPGPIEDYDQNRAHDLEVARNMTKLCKTIEAKSTNLGLHEFASWNPFNFDTGKPESTNRVRINIRELDE